MMFFGKRVRCLACGVLPAVLVLQGAVLRAAYRPLEVPGEWTFKVATPATHPESGEHLGDFQPGITVQVLEELPGEKRWRVVFRRFGAPDVEALIAVPCLVAGDARLEVEVGSALENFPLLRAQLEAEEPWPSELTELAKRHFQGTTLDAGTMREPERLSSTSSGRDGRAWGMEPLLLSADYRVSGDPRLIFEFWNKGDAHRTRLRADQAYRELSQRLEGLERLFGTRRGLTRQSAEGSGITAVRDQAELYYLPNDTVATLRYRAGEYLLMELSSYRALGGSAAPSYDPATFAESMRGRVKTAKEGHRYVSGVPMISQGNKGYCASATLARVLNYYGYPVDMHSLADLARTEAARGTTRNNIIASMRRVCGSTPFRMRELNTRRRADILEVIERGLPILWVVPGHMRLLIGVHPEGGIVYSDSWGPGHEYKVMDWNTFTNENRGMWVLEPTP